MADIGAVILAAGTSSRMGENKLLLPLGDSTVLGIFLASFPYHLFQQTVLVYSDAEVKYSASAHPLRCCQNPSPEQGQSGSIRRGLKHCITKSIMFFAADQPLLRHSTITCLLNQASKTPKKIIRPVCNGKAANPVIFPDTFRQQLMNLEGDTGGREIIRANREAVIEVEIEEPEQFIDIDTQEDYNYVQKLWRTRK